MRNTVAEKPARVVSVRMNEVDAIRLHAHRKENNHPMSKIVMAGVEALSGSPKWFKLFMLSEIVPIDSEKTAFTLYVLAEGYRIERGMNFEVVSYYDAHQVIATRRHMGAREEVELYAGTRHNCELVAEHLNKILREAEEKVSNE